MEYPRTTIAAIIATAAAALSIGVATITTLNTGTLKVGTDGTTITKHVSATTTVDPMSMGPFGAISTDITVTGAAAGNTVELNLPAAWVTTSTVLFRGVAGTNKVTVYMLNASSSAFDLSSAVVGADVWAH